MVKKNFDFLLLLAAITILYRYVYEKGTIKTTIYYCVVFRFRIVVREMCLRTTLVHTTHPGMNEYKTCRESST